MERIVNASVQLYWYEYLNYAAARRSSFNVFLKHMSTLHGPFSFIVA